MLSICPSCGAYRPDKDIDSIGPYAICPECGHRQKFVQLPLFLITGASGSGKSAICLESLSRMSGVVVLEGDLLWRKEFDTPENDYTEFWDVWLRLCVDISQSGRPVVLFASARPAQLEGQTARRYFSETRYLALVCDAEVLTERLQNRPDWRQSGNEEYIGRHLKWNQWLRDNAAKTTPPMTILDTSSISVLDAADRVAEWVGERLDGGEGKATQSGSRMT